MLDEIGAGDVPELVVVNKADASAEAARLAKVTEGAVCVSARTGEGIDDLLRAVADRLRVADRVVELVIPWARGDVLAAVHREGEVVGQSAGDEAAPASTSCWTRPAGPASTSSWRPRRDRGGRAPAASSRRPTPTTAWPS